VKEIEQHLFLRDNLKEMFSYSLMNLKDPNLLDKGSLIDQMIKNPKDYKNNDLFKE